MNCTKHTLTQQQKLIKRKIYNQTKTKHFVVTEYRVKVSKIYSIMTNKILQKQMKTNNKEQKNEYIFLKLSKRTPKKQKQNKNINNERISLIITTK